MLSGVKNVIIGLNVRGAFSRKIKQRSDSCSNKAFSEEEPLFTTMKKEKILSER